MTINKILNISGKPGLYYLISTAKGHIVVESLEDKKRFPIPGTKQINTLENIAIYTWTKEVPLPTVLYTISQKVEGKEALSHVESNAKLLDFFKEILPDFDTDRVYVSNIKKIVQWYNILVKAQFDFTALAPVETDETVPE